jgi:hypothetical protein
MHKRRFRLPSPALVISTLALAVALGGTAFAANTTVTAKSKHKDQKADTKLIKKLAPTLSVKHAKTATSANTAANATHATTADSATTATSAATATTATTATTASNSAALGGVAASSYLTNAGSIFVSTGSSNWTSLHPLVDNIEWLYTSNATWAVSGGTGSVILVAHPSLATALYGKKLEATGATLCYTATANAKITEVSFTQATYSSSGVGAAHTLADDQTVRTDSACRTYPFSTPAPLSSLDDVSVAIFVTYTGSSTFLIGQSGITLAPTSTVAAAAKAASHSTGAQPTPDGLVTH